jgi:hypothetical protein
MTGEQLRSRLVAGRRSTLEVVCHVADCEQFFADRIKRTVAMAVVADVTDAPLPNGGRRSAKAKASRNGTDLQHED